MLGVAGCASSCLTNDDNCATLFGMSLQEQYNEMSRRRAESAAATRQAMRDAATAAANAEWGKALDYTRQARNHLTTYGLRLELERAAYNHLYNAS